MPIVRNRQILVSVTFGELQRQTHMSEITVVQEHVATDLHLIFASIVFMIIYLKHYNLLSFLYAAIAVFSLAASIFECINRG